MDSMEEMTAKVTVLDLPDAVLAHVLVLAGRTAMINACASCRALHQLSDSDVLWSEYNASRYPRFADLAPERLGVRSHRELTVALAALEPYAGLYVSLSEYPWGRLVAVSLELGGADGARLVGRLLRAGVAEVAEEPAEGAEEGEAVPPVRPPARPVVRAHATAASDELFAVRLRDVCADDDAAAAAVGLRVRAGGDGARRGWLASTRAASSVERARAAELAPPALGEPRRRSSLLRLLELGGLGALTGGAGAGAGADRRELLWPWLVDAGEVAMLFPHIWPVAGTARIHDGHLVALQLAPRSGAAAAAAGAADGATASAAGGAAVAAAGVAGGAQTAEERQSARHLIARLDAQLRGQPRAHAPPTAADGAGAAAEGARPHPHTARGWARALAAHGVALPDGVRAGDATGAASARASRSRRASGSESGAEADADAEVERGPFVLLARLHSACAAAAPPVAPAPARAGWSSAATYPPEVLSHPSLCAWARALPALGVYAADYGPLYGPRRVECVQLRVVRFADDPRAEAAAARLGGGGAAADWHLRAARPAAAQPQAEAEAEAEAGDRGQFSAGSTYLLALKLLGDPHVPMGACTFAIELLDARGQARAPRPLGEGGEGGCRWAGWGCLAFPGFRAHSFTEGALTVHDAPPPAPTRGRGAPSASAEEPEAVGLGPRASFRALGPGPANESFSFAWAGESSHVYHRLPIDDSTFRLTDAPAELRA